MNYSNSFGWLSLAPTSRTTEVTPPAHSGSPVVGQPWPNWTGVEWVLANYVEPPVYSAPTVTNVWDWFIDIGPFMDRFGSAKFPVLLCTEPIVKAMIADMQSRKWIDLQRADVAAALAYMHGSAVPGLGTIGTPIASITTELISAILTTPVTAEENLALRKLYY